MLNWSTFSHVFCKIGELTNRINYKSKVKTSINKATFQVEQTFVEFSCFEILQKAIVVS
ncbi:MAG: hypothetical protein ACTS4Z_00180 [Candidatus Hodgkinia cicadicola]